MSKTEYSQEEVFSLIQQNLVESRAELKQLMKILKHGQKDRLLEAISEYPELDLSVKGEAKPFCDAWACLKRIQDANVALGVEVVIQQMAKNHGVQQENKNVEG